MAFVNHHSFLIVGGLLLGTWAIFLLARRTRKGWILWGLVAMALAAGWLIVRPRPDQQPQTVEEIKAVLASDQPVLVEIYSEY